MKKYIISLSILSALLMQTASANLLTNPGLEITSYGAGANAGLSVDSWPVTVDGSDTEFQKFLGDWVIQAAGNWTSAPGGTGNSSDNVWALRKGGNRTGQILPLNSAGAGDPLAVSWEYMSATDNSDVTFHVRLFGVNEGGATISNAGGSFGGTEGVDWGIIENQSVTVLAADADSVWKTHAPAPITLTQDWDYIGLSFHYTGGTTNSSTLQQMDTFSIQVIPEPSSLLLSAAGLLVGLTVCRRRRRS